MQSQNFLDPQTLARLHGLQLRAQHIVEGYVSGLHRSPYHGFSIEFAEHREYAPGDDLRYVDWKVFGRTDKFYLKQYEDETNLVCHLVLDVSESMRYKSPGAALSKLEYAQCIAASLGWLVIHQQDAVGLATFDNQVRSLVEPGSKPSHIRQLLHVLENIEPKHKSDAGPVFHDLSARQKKRGVVLILSDLFDNVEKLLAGLKHFRHRRHDVIVFHILDDAELDFPFDNPTMFKGLEEFPEILADPRSLKRAYLQEFQAYLKQIQTGCRNQRVDYNLIRTGQDLGVSLSTYLASRAARMK